MITIEIDDNSLTGVKILDGYGNMQGHIQDIVISAGGPATTMVAKVFVYDPHGIHTAQVLKDHGFQVMAVDPTQLDDDGNWLTYMF